MMKRFLIVCCLVAVLPIAALAQSYSALLTGAAEVPGPGDPDGAGFAVVSIDGTTIRYNVFVQGIGTPTLAHIHIGAAGTSGNPVVNLDVNMLANGAVQGVPQDVIDAIRANPSGYYVNVHTSDFPQGAVRGQLIQPFQAGARTQYIPVVGKATGAAGENFVTDMRIINYGASSAVVTLDYFQASAQGHAAPTATAAVTVAPGEQEVLDDMLTLLNASGIGGLRVSSTESIEVRARVLDDQRAGGEGTTGFSVEAGELADARTAGSLGFLSAATSAEIAAGVGFRSNIGWFNPNATPASATFTARATDGSILGTKTVTIPGYSMVQQGAFALVDSVPAGSQEQENFYMTWTSDAPLFVYAAVVDNKTGDSVLVQ